MSYAVVVSIGRYEEGDFGLVKRMGGQEIIQRFETEEAAAAWAKSIIKAAE